MSTFLMFIFFSKFLSVRRPIFALCPRFAATKSICHSFFFNVDWAFEIDVQSGEFGAWCSGAFTPKTAPKDATVAPTTSLTPTKTVPKDPTAAPSTSLYEKLEPPNSCHYLPKNPIQMGDSTFTIYPSCVPLCHSEREGKHLSQFDFLARILYSGSFSH